MFVGSSFTYGFPFPEHQTFPSIIMRMTGNDDVFNASFVAADLTGTVDYAICPLLRRQSSIRYLFIEIPIVNTVSYIEGYMRRNLRFSLNLSNICSGSESGYHSYFATFLREPFGFAWLRLLWDSEYFIDDAAPIAIQQLPSEYFGTEQEFEQVRSTFKDAIDGSLRLASKAAERVIVYPTPVYVPGIAEAGGDTRAVTEQFQAALQACRGVPGVVCLDTSEFLNRREMYFNLTHLNHAGHTIFARWLAERLRTGFDQPVAQGSAASSAGP